MVTSILTNAEKVASCTTVLITLGSFTNWNSYYVFTLKVGKVACHKSAILFKAKKRVVGTLYLQNVHFVHVQ